MVPIYTKLGQETKDLFEQHYNIGSVKIDVKNKIQPTLGFDFTGACNTETGQVNSALETKYDFSQYGFTTNAKWTTENDLLTEILVSDKSILDGLKVSFNTKYALVSGKKSGNIKTSYEKESYNVIGDIDFESSTPQLNASGVYKYNDMLLASQAQIDMKSFNILKHSLAIGYCQDGVSILSKIDNFKEINLGLYKKMNASVERGVQLTWDEKNNAQLAFACQHIIDNSSTIKAKIINTGQIGLAYVYQYRPGVKVSVSSLVEAKNLLTGGHKLGLGLTFEG